MTVGSANVRNLAITNNLPHAVLAQLVGLEGQSELVGTGPPAQVVPAGATAGFDVHFKCNTEQVQTSEGSRVGRRVGRRPAVRKPSLSEDREGRGRGSGDGGSRFVFAACLRRNRVCNVTRRDMVGGRVAGGGYSYTRRSSLVRLIPCIRVRSVLSPS